MKSGLNRKSAATRRAGLAVVVTATLGTSACAAGQRAETAEEKATIDGTNVDIGAMQLRGLALEAPVAKPYYPEGADVAVKVVLVNSGTSTDRLTNISSSAFGTWSAYRSAAEATAVQNADDPLAEPSSSASSASSASAPASGSASGSSSSGSSASSGSAGSEPTGSTPGLLSGAAGTGSIAASATGLTALAVPPGSRVGFATPEATGALLVMKLKRALYPGNTISIRFTFAKAGSKSVLVPVQLTAGPNDSVIPEPTGSQAEG